MDTSNSHEDAAFLSESKGPTTLAVVIFFTAFSTIAVVLRFISRFILFKNAGYEDYLIGVAMAFSIAMAGCMIEQVNYGNGRHAAALDLNQAIGILKYLYWSIFAYCAALTLIKLSILFQYLRIFALEPKARIAIYTIMAVVVAYGIESVMTGLFTCRPIRAFWDIPLQATAKCINHNSLWYANAALNIVTDLAIAAFPLPLIAKLNMQKSQKIAIGMLLAIGWFVCLVSMLRLNALVVLAKHPQDSSYYSPEAAYWSCIEVNTAIVCASMPSLRKLAVQIFPAVFRKLDSRRPTLGYSSGSREVGGAGGVGGGGSGVGGGARGKGMKAFVELDGSSGTELVLTNSRYTRDVHGVV